MVKVKISDWKADSSMDEAYKALRTNIQFCGADKKVIAFTSCTPNEGKSNVTFHLAASLAESGKSVLLIDADLRKSVLMGRVQVEEEVKGLTHYLSKQAKLQDVICASNLPKFHIIFSGVVPPNPAELLGSRQFKDMIRVVKNCIYLCGVIPYSLRKKNICIHRCDTKPLSFLLHLDFLM